MTAYQAQCWPRDEAFCHAMWQPGRKDLEVSACYPTAEMCASMRVASSASGEWLTEVCETLDEPPENDISKLTEHAVPRGTNPPAPDLESWCFQAVGGAVGACEATPTACAERVVRMSRGLTLFVAECQPQSTVYCFAMAQTDDPAERAAVMSCYPTAVLCADARVLIASVDVSTADPECTMQ